VGTENAWGGIKVKSVLEPQPAQAGLFKFISTIRQSSPLKPHLPVCRYAMAEEKEPWLVNELLTKVMIFPPWISVGVPNPQRLSNAIV